MAEQNPSAPPEEDEYEWVSKSMKQKSDDFVQINNEHNVEQPGLDQIEQKEEQTQGFQQPSNMPDAISQQLIYQKIMEEQKKKKEQKQNNEEQQKEKEKEQKQNDPNLHQLGGPKPSYISLDAQYPETSLYKAAGICVWRPKQNGKGIQFMMGVEKTNNSLSWFGGKRDKTDKSAVDTALREFHEETGKKLDDETLGQMRRMLLTDNDRKVFWKSEWCSFLYFYQMAYDYDIVRDYNKNKGLLSEMKAIHWVDFEKIYNSVCITGNPIKLTKNKRNRKTYGLRSFIAGMMLHDEVRSYLFKLHIKHNGDINGIKPRNGGTIRKCLSSFTSIPKIIRLDIINPITNNLIYHRWIEENIQNIEDYQLLTSFISSVVPEIGMNFHLYYCNNEQFKLSKKQFIIDTIPSFNKLKIYILNNKKKHFITQICIVPTFILSDNFKGISLSFKNKDVSYKHIIDVDNDNKGFVSSVYNKAAKWWNKDNLNNNNDDNKQNNNDFGSGLYFDAEHDDNINWKWQYQNDSNNFEDFCLENSKLIEKAFMSGCTFIGYKNKLSIPYQANFSKMMQKNLNSQKIRPIRRVPENTESEKELKRLKNLKNNYKLKSYSKWQYQDDDGSWKDYDIVISKKLNQFKTTYDNNYSQNRYHYHYHSSNNIKIITVNNYKYSIDITKLKQINQSTSKQRNIRQIQCNDNDNHHNYYNSNQNIKYYKWQYKDDGFNNWSDYELESSKYIEQQYNNNRNQSFIITLNKNNKQYQILLSTKQQRAMATNKYRAIKRVEVYNHNHNSFLGIIGGKNINNMLILNKWEWADDDGQWKAYNKTTSSQIEKAYQTGIKKYFFVSNKNSNSYEISFTNMNQYNIQSGKKRNVRKLLIKAAWSGMGPDPDNYKGPNTFYKNFSRKSFGSQISTLYCCVGDSVSSEIKKSGKCIRGTLGPFGSGLYWYDSQQLAKDMAKNRNYSRKGNLIQAKIFIGRENDVSNMDDKQFDFMKLQKTGYDSVSRYIGIGKEYIIYNHDQICIVKQSKY